MKKSYFSVILAAIFFISFSGVAQVLNQPAGWPNTNWTVTGTYDNDPLAFEADPTLTPNFAFDDDEAGSGSDDSIAAESPIIDLTPAHTAGETWISITVDYGYRYLPSDVLEFQYYDADAASWMSWENASLPGNNTSVNDNFCSITKTTYVTAILDVGGFTATQLTGFRYRIFYDDNPAGSDWNYGFCFDAPTIKSEAPPTCLIPTILTANGITDTTVDLEWTENGSATTWDVHVVPAGDPAPDASTTPSDIGVTTNPYNKTGLSAQTDYEFYVRADCGGGDLSDWAGPFAFTTLCAAVTTPWLDDVEAHTPTTNLGNSNCWSTASVSTYDWNIDGSGSTPSSSTGPSGAFSGNNYFYTEATNGSTGDEAELYTPLIDLTGLSIPSLQFYYHMYGQNMGELHVDIHDGTNWVNDVFVLIGEQQTADTDPWLQAIVDLTAYSGTIQVRFRAIKGASFEGDISLDDIEVKEGPTCFAPVDLSATAITDVSADLGWSSSASTWDIEVVTAGTTPTGTPTDAGVTTNPYNKTGLTSQTDYEFYVRADCGATDGQSTWAGPFAFTTECSPMVAPWLDDVEAHTPTTSLGDSNCWSTTSVSAYDWNIDGSGSTPTSNTGPSGAHSGSNYFYIETSGSAGDVAELYTPLVDISALTTPSLRFYYHMYGADMGELHVDVHDGATWVNDVVVLIGEKQTDDTDPWLDQVVDLTSYSGIIQVRFRAISAGTTLGDMAIDDIEFMNGPSCFPPVNLTATGITATSADLGWISSATTWDIEVVTAGTTPTGTPTDVGVTTNPYNKTGLTDDSDYEFYVRADCGGGDLSTWAGPFKFTTPCISKVAPWTEDFENAGVIPDCWAQGATNGKDWGFTNVGTGHIGDGGTIIGNTQSGGYFAWLDDSSPHNIGTTLLSPFIDVSGLTVPELTFYRLSNNEGETNVDFSVDVWDGAAWNNDMYFSNSNSAGGGWEKVIINLSTLTITGDIQIRFVIDENNGTDFYDDMAIDDVSVHEKPTCPEPNTLTVSNITNTSADLGWIDNAGASTWDIHVVIANSPAPDASTTPSNPGVTTNPYNLTGLGQCVTYEFYVRANCGPGDLSTWAGPFAFSPTGTGPAVAPWTEDFENGGLIPNCWTQGASNSEDWLFDNDPSGTHIGNNGNIVGSTPSGGYFAWVDDSSPSSIGTTLVSPTIDVSALTAPQLRFFLISDNEGETNVDFSVDVYDGAAWNNDVYFSNTNTLNGGWEEIIVDLSSLTITGNIQIRFVVDENNGSDLDDDVAIDDVSIVETPNCLQPSNLNASAIMATSADLGWTENNTPPATTWDVYVVPAGDPAPTSTTVPTDAGVTANPYNKTGLTANTAYEFYVRTDCGSGTSFWVGPFAFTTPCGTMVAPWTEDFENGGSIPDCWVQGASNSEDWKFSNTAGSNHIGNNGDFYGTTTASGGYFAWVDDSSPNNMGTTLESPMVDVSGLITPALSFYLISDNENHTNVSFSVDFYDGATWHTGIYTSNSNTGGWMKVYIDLSTYTISGPVQARFIVDENNGTDFYDDLAIDDVSFDELPTCLEPSNLTVANVGSTTADLGWTQVGAATTWDIEVVPAGTTPTGTPTDAGVTTNPYNKTGLNPFTNYEFYVRADCGGGDLSNWSGPFAFTTECAAIVTPWLDDVEAHTPTTTLGDSNCWSTASVGAYDWNIDGSGSTPSLNTGPSGAFSGNNYFYTEASSGGAGDAAELYTPLLDLSAVNAPALRFYYHMYGADMGDLHVDVYDGSAWVNSVFVLNGQQQTAETDPWLEQMIDLTAYSGTIQIRFRAIRGSSFEGDVALDDIEIMELPCYDPSDITFSNIGKTSVDISWTENGGATEWEIEYGTAGFTPGSGTLIVDNDGILGETLTGLSSATVYDVYVRAICASGNNSAWIGPINFSTACDTILTFPYEESFEDTSQYRPCWIMEYVSSDEDWEYVGANQNGTVTPRTGALMAEFSTTNPQGDVTKLVSPALNLTGVSNPTLEFYYANVNWNGDVDELRVYYKTSFMGPWIQIGTDYTTENTSWTFVSLNLPNPTADYYVAFEGTSNYGRGLDIDDVWIGPGMGVDDAVFNDFVYYPNPTSNELFLEANNNIEQVVVYNLLGQEIINIQPNQLTPVIDVSGLQSGAYLMKVKIAGSEAVFRIIKE